MAYTLHATGKTVTVAKAEQFAKQQGVKISAGFRAGGWFCFIMPKVANLKADKAVAATFFKGAIIETSTERNARCAAAPRGVSDFTPAIHLEIAESIRQANPCLSTIELCELVGGANQTYSETHGNLKHYATDYYAVQAILMDKV